MECRVSVDKHACMSSGRCVAIAPEIFGFDDAGLAEVLDPSPDLTSGEADELIDGCPGGAVDVVFPA